MRKVRDYDAELKVLEERARALKARRVEQLGSLVTSTGADALDLEILAGVLLDAVASKDTDAKEAWRAKGAAFFQRRGRKPVPSNVEGAGQKAGNNGDDGTSQRSRAPADNLGTVQD